MLVKKKKQQKKRGAYQGYDLKLEKHNYNLKSN